MQIKKVFSFFAACLVAGYLYGEQAQPISQDSNMVVCDIGDISLDDLEALEAIDIASEDSDKDSDLDLLTKLKLGLVYASIVWDQEKGKAIAHIVAHKKIYLAGTVIIVAVLTTGAVIYYVKKNDRK